MAKEIIRAEGAPTAVGPYSQAIRIGRFVYSAGQLGVNPATGQLAGEDVASQTEQALRNLRAVLEAAGTTLENAVKTTVFLVDINDFAAMNAAYAPFFGAQPPARTTVAVAALPRVGGRVEIEVVAFIPE
jgi:2-iminobutanoate/2-iminopropanoate deaminase